MGVPRQISTAPRPKAMDEWKIAMRKWQEGKLVERIQKSCEGCGARGIAFDKCKYCGRVV